MEYGILSFPTKERIKDSKSIKATPRNTLIYQILLLIKRLINNSHVTNINFYEKLFMIFYVYNEESVLYKIVGYNKDIKSSWKSYIFYYHLYNVMMDNK